MVTSTTPTTVTFTATVDQLDALVESLCDDIDAGGDPDGYLAILRGIAATGHAAAQRWLDVFTAEDDEDDER